MTNIKNKKTYDGLIRTPSTKENAAGRNPIARCSPKDMDLALRNQSLPDEGLLAICSSASPPPKTHGKTTKIIKSPNKLPDTLVSVSRSTSADKGKTHTSPSPISRNI